MSKKEKQQNNDEFDFGALAKGVGGEILDDFDKLQWGFVDTGILALNFAVSGKFVGGGFPSGKCVEVFGNSSSGKSLIGTNLLRGCQTAKGVAVFLDAERTLSKDFAVKASHVDPKRLLVVEADTLERSFAKIHKVIRQVRQEVKVPLERPLVIVYDSIAVSPSEREFAETTIDLETATQAEIKEAGAGADKPGERAKICSKELRKLPPILSENNATVLFINQIRQKVGVMFGCFHGDSRVQLADGRRMRIKHIVRKKLPVEVLSYNRSTGAIEPKRVVGWHMNGMAEYFLQFLVEKFHGDGRTQFACTPNHVLFRQRGQEVVEVHAGDLEVGDKILISEKFYLTNDQKQVVYGSVLGDGSLRHLARMSHLRIGHGKFQKNYCKWKMSLLEPWVCSKYEREEAMEFDTISMFELNGLKYRTKPGKNRECEIPKEIADNLDLLGLAVWYMDDGNFDGHYEKYGYGKSYISCTKFRNKEIMMPFFKKIGLNPSCTSSGFFFSSEDTYKMHSMIARYVPMWMEYKLHPTLRGKYDFSPKAVSATEFQYRPVEAKVLKVYKKPHPSKQKFDLTVEGNGTYVVNGAIAHNSDETTAGGGRGLEFYGSCRLKMSSFKHIKDGLGNVIGVNVNVRNLKNKCFRPFVEVKSLRLFFNKGIDPFGGLLEVLLQDGRIEASGPGNYVVREPYAAGKAVKFKSSKERNDVPAEVLLECPALVDAKSPDQVMYYVNMFGSALEAVRHDIAEEEAATPEE